MWLGLSKQLANITCTGVLTAFLSGALGAVPVSDGIAQEFEGYSDPLRPEASVKTEATPHIPIHRIPARLHAIDRLIAQEAQALAMLAPLKPAKQFDQFGYHSDYIPAIEGVPEVPLWTLEFDTGIQNRRILGVMLVPTIDERSSGSKGYAFPKRFRIVLVDSVGKPEIVHVDWTEQDFPDPGMRPVVFKFPTQYATGKPLQLSRKSVRLEVFGGHESDGLEYFSLARVYLIRTDEVHWPRKVSVSSSFESLPYWSKDYLASPRSTLGMPLFGNNGGGDLELKLSSSKLPQPLVIRVEIAKPKTIGQLNIFPGKSPDEIDVPGYGFPKSMKVYRLVKEDGIQRRYRIGEKEVPSIPGNNMIRFPGRGRKITALEIECNDFQVYQGQVIFALGEIQVFMRGENLSEGQRVTIQGGLTDHSKNEGLLVDGRAGGLGILPLSKWIEQLAIGKQHEARIGMLEMERSQLDSRWQRIRESVWIIIAMLLLVGVCSFVGYMLYSRKRAQLQLRKQICADLHDNVGSSLGSITLITEQLQYSEVNGRLREDLYDLALLARESWASLREAVWVIDEKSIRLPALIDKMTERAKRLLAGIELEVELPESCPDLFVSLMFKRHFIMYFKEVIHNCARHSGASHVQLSFKVDGGNFCVSVSDDGCGFDTSVTSNGVGLDSMKNRTREIGGELRLVSAPGKGAQILLKVPLKALLKSTDYSYKTSN